MQTIAGNYQPFGHQRIALTNTNAAALTVPNGARLALIQVENYSIRWLPDSNPTTTEGMIMNPGQTLWYDSALRLFRVCATQPGAVITVCYFG